ncbi:V-type ATP synthase subunit D [bacterium]|nr:V-type ATP synthase subunit D [bacterium]
MAKIRLTKNELKKHKDDLKRFTRYLPTLELKKKQLLMEIRKIQNEINRLQEENRQMEEHIFPWVGVFAQDVDLASLIVIQEVKKGIGNIAGIDIPVFGSLTFDEVTYDFMDTPLWVDTGIDVVKEQIERRVRWEIAERQQEIIREELRTTIQRIKLFEEVKIPEAKEAIRTIQIFLGDLQTASVVRGKIAKTKIMKKKQEAQAA